MALNASSWVAPFLPLPLHCGRGEPPSRRLSASRELHFAPPHIDLGARPAERDRLIAGSAGSARFAHLPDPLRPVIRWEG
ncbi:hypothetical protein EV714DRAFT_278454 [Schizophyllum commune]